MTGPQIDYGAVYRQLPAAVVLLTPEFVIADANLAFAQTAGRSREELLGSNVFDVFPEDPSDPGATGVHKSIAAREPSDRPAIQNPDRLPALRGIAPIS